MCNCSYAYFVLMISRYSVNEGRCWFKYKFTEHQFHVTGLVTEPGAKTMRFSLWGNTMPSPEWQVITVDFEKVLARACKLIILAASFKSRLTLVQDQHLLEILISVV